MHVVCVLEVIETCCTLVNIYFGQALRAIRGMENLYLDQLLTIELEKVKPSMINLNATS